jgi:hypothetical protein
MTLAGNHGVKAQAQNQVSTAWLKATLEGCAVLEGYWWAERIARPCEQAK